MKNKPIIFLLTPQQWLGLLILLILAGAALFFLHRFQPTTEPTLQLSDSTLTAFTQHQSLQDSLRKAQWKKQYPRDTIALHLQPFDPNTADSSTLVHLGLKPWQASNMLKYRAKNGRYRQAEDLKKLYGMTDSMYQALLPYIQIDTLAVRLFRDSLYHAQRPRVSPVRADSDTLARDTTPRYISHKRDTVLNLRTADTTELKMIRGIGAYRAKQIVRYREQLGGFASVEQLREVKALQPLLSDSLSADSLSADSLLGHFVLDSVKVVPLRVNMAHVESLQRHPYLSFEQAKAIYELRRRKIRLKSIDQLRTLDCLSESDLLRLQPYLSFE
jgi:competence ComEA-like helix-hairpin-helix protein